MCGVASDDIVGRPGQSMDIGAGDERGGWEAGSLISLRCCGGDDYWYAWSGMGSVTLMCHCALAMVRGYTRDNGTVKPGCSALRSVRLSDHHLRGRNGRGGG